MLQSAGRKMVSISTESVGLWKSTTWTSNISTAEPGILFPGIQKNARKNEKSTYVGFKQYEATLSIDPFSVFTYVNPVFVLIIGLLNKL